jgi:hypothetical protein
MSENNFPPPPLQNQLTELPKIKRSRKKLWIALGLILVIASVSVVAAINYPRPNGLLGQDQPLTLSFGYTKGEVMKYSLKTITLVSVQKTPQPTAQNSTQTATITEEVLSVDGDNFTIRTTTTPISPSGVQSLVTMKMDKSGRIIDYGDLPSESIQLMQSMSTIPGFGSYFSRQEAKVGDSWQVPLSTQYSGISFQGTINYKIVAVKSVTVPAGTYNVVSIDITANQVKMNLASSGSSVDFNVNYNGQINLEKGTCRLIQLDMEETATATINGETGTISATMQMQLEQHSVRKYGDAATPSTLKFTQTMIYSSSSAGEEETYTVYIKNFNTPYVMSRAEGTYDGQQIISITDGVNQKLWSYFNSQWQDTTFMTNGNWTTVDEGWDLLRSNLKNWSGSGELTYTIPTGDIFRLTNIEVNPNLPDSLFQKP